MGIINTLFAGFFVIMAYCGFLILTEMPRETAIITNIDVKQLDEDSVQCEIAYKSEDKASAVSISPTEYCESYAVGDKVLIKDGKVYRTPDLDEDF